jgi:hypothetical protein
MTTRYFYLRDNENRQPRGNGTLTRGNPIAILISEVDRTANTIKYAFAVAHPQDSFMKDLGRRIVSARLQDPKKSFTIPLVVGADGKPNCHDITRSILNDILHRAKLDEERAFCSSFKTPAAAKANGFSWPVPPTRQDVPHRMRDAVIAWLSDSALTIPAPAMSDGVEVVIPEEMPAPAIRA